MNDAPAPKSKAWRRPVFLAVSAAFVLAVLILAQAILLPFILALVIAYVLMPAVERVQRFKVPRPLAIILLYIALVGAMVLGVRVAAPRIGEELVALKTEIPQVAKQAQEKWIPEALVKLRELGLVPPEAAPPPPEDQPEIVVKPLEGGGYTVDLGAGIAVDQTKTGYIVEPVKPDKGFDPAKLLSNFLGKSFTYAQENTGELLKIVRDVVAGVWRAVFGFFITLMLAAYLMMSKEKIFAFFASLVRPSNRGSFDKLLARVDQGLGGVIRGQLVICLINGGLSAIGFAIVGLKYWPVLALVAAMLSLIPIFGSIASAVPAVAVGLTQGIGTALFVLAWIIGIHQLEANFLNPKIMGDAAKIHPVLVVFSLLLGEHFFGAMGALLAVPCMSLAKCLFVHFKEITDARDPELASPDPSPASGGKR